MQHRITVKNFLRRGCKAALFSTGFSECDKIVTGDWRKTISAMQVLSGIQGKDWIDEDATSHRGPDE